MRDWRWPLPARNRSCECLRS